MDFDPMPYRRDCAAVMAGRIHLNNAGASLMPDPVLDTVQEHLRTEAEIGGYEAADLRKTAILQVYANVAALLGARPANIAVVENATAAMALALSAFDLARGDVIITTRNDYISNQLMYLSLARRAGIRVLRAEDTPEGGVDPESVRTLIRQHQPRFVSLTWVPTNSGLVQPAAEVGEICAAEGVPYIVDACQAVGQLPVDVHALQCDYLAATARKFLRGPRGVGFLYVSDRALEQGSYPLYVDMRGAAWIDDDIFELAPDARRFENWEFAYALLLGMGAAAKYALDADVARAGARAATLAAYARARLCELPRVRVLDKGTQLCAIATAEFEGVAAPDIVARLREQAINTSATAREWAVLDMKDKGAHAALRISPHYYNTLREIDIAVSALEEFTDAA